MFTHDISGQTRTSRLENESLVRCGEVDSFESIEVDLGRSPLSFEALLDTIDDEKSIEYFQIWS